MKSLHYGYRRLGANMHLPPLVTSRSNSDKQPLSSNHEQR